MNSGLARRGDSRHLHMRNVPATQKSLVERWFFSVSVAFRKPLGHPSVSLVLSGLGPIDCPMVEEYDRATRSTLAFSGERGKRGAFAARSEWGELGGNEHADVRNVDALHSHPKRAPRTLGLPPRLCRFPRVAGACSGGQHQRERQRERELF